MHEFRMKIDNHNFLWVTRGEKWGFRFLSKCSAPSLAPYIHTVYQEIFSRDESRFGYWKGRIIIDDKIPTPYVACRCYDTCMQQDEAGRRIPHEFLLLCSDDEFRVLGNLAWSQLIFEKVRERYNERFHCDFNEVSDCLCDFCIELPPNIDASESCIYHDVHIAAHPNKIPNMKPKLLWIFVFLAILSTFLVAYAIYSKAHKAQNKSQFQNTNTDVEEQAFKGRQNKQ